MCPVAHLLCLALTGVSSPAAPQHRLSSSTPHCAGSCSASRSQRQWQQNAPAAMDIPEGPLPRPDSHHMPQQAGDSPLVPATTNSNSAVRLIYSMQRYWGGLWRTRMRPRPGPALQGGGFQTSRDQHRCPLKRPHSAPPSHPISPRDVVVKSWFEETRSLEGYADQMLLTNRFHSPALLVEVPYAYITT